MKIEPVKISITDSTDAVNMYISAIDSWGNEEQDMPSIYEAVATLTDEYGYIRKKLTIVLQGKEYEEWDSQNSTILQMFLDKYSWLKLKN